MKLVQIVSLAVLLSIFSSMGTAQQESSDNLGLFVNGIRIEQIDSDSLLSTLEPILSQLGYQELTDKAARAELKGLLDRVESGEQDDVPVVLSGIAGFTVIRAIRYLLYLADRSFILTGDVIDRGDIQLREAQSGKIRDYLYDNIRKSGRLGVEMTIDLFASSPVPVRRELLYWDVEVDDGGYSVHVRNDTTRDDPFPGTIELPSEAKDPLNGNSIWVRELDHKLFATGKEDSNGERFIKILNVFRKINNGPMVRLDPATHAYYRIDDDSCIDMMFIGYPRAVVLPPQKGYCLGRCKEPNIINSGV